MFSEAMDWQSVATNSSEDVIIYPVNGGHRSGSSQIKVKNIVDSSWDKKFHWGNLVATHFKGQYFAYALTGACSHNTCMHVFTLLSKWSC